MAEPCVWPETGSAEALRRIIADETLQDCGGNARCCVVVRANRDLAAACVAAFNAQSPLRKRPAVSAERRPFKPDFME